MLQGASPNDSGTIALVALGANTASEVGAPAQTLRAALAELPSAQVDVVRSSRLYSTPCHPPGAGPDYVNAAVALSTTLAPRALLAHLHVIENRYGRVREQRWGMRTLDLDLLAYGDTVLPDVDTQRRWQELPEREQRIRAPEELVVPHPRMQDRGFVLIPLAEIAPDWRHPVTGITVAQMLERLPRGQKSEIAPL